jgi:Arc/MetJ family transcription regulator
MPTATAALILDDHTLIHPGVYTRVVTRTNIEIDDELVERAMRIYRLRSKRETVDLALRKLVGEPMTREEMLAMEGMGWAGDLDEMRSQEVPEL